MRIPNLAHIGDVIECKVSHPHPGIIRMRLVTPASCAYANSLLMFPETGWARVDPCDRGDQCEAAGPV